MTRQLAVSLGRVVIAGNRQPARYSVVYGVLLGDLLRSFSVVPGGSGYGGVHALPGGGNSRGGGGAAGGGYPVARGGDSGDDADAGFRPGLLDGRGVGDAAGPAAGADDAGSGLAWEPGLGRAGGRPAAAGSHGGLRCGICGDGPCGRGSGGGAFRRRDGRTGFHLTAGDARGSAPFGLAAGLAGRPATRPLPGGLRDAAVHGCGSLLARGRAWFRRCAFGRPGGSARDPVRGCFRGLASGCPWSPLRGLAGVSARRGAGAGPVGRSRAGCPGFRSACRCGPGGRRGAGSRHAGSGRRGLRFGRAGPGYARCSGLRRRRLPGRLVFRS